MSHNHREVRRVTRNSEPSASAWPLGPDPAGCYALDQPTGDLDRQGQGWLCPEPTPWPTPWPSAVPSLGPTQRCRARHRKDSNPQGGAEPRARMGGCTGGRVES